MGLDGLFQIFKAKIVDCNYLQILSKPIYKGITTSVAVDIELSWGEVLNNV